MTNDEIDGALNRLGISDQVSKLEHGLSTRWSFGIEKRPAYIQTQTDVDRMRIVSEIGDPDGSEHADTLSLLRANFRTALDARYALDGDKLVATFIHPLASLSKDSFISGFMQVLACTLSAGSENSGGSLVFGDPHGSTKATESISELISSVKKSSNDYEVHIYSGARSSGSISKDVVVPIVGAIIGAAGGYLAK